MLLVKRVKPTPELTTERRARFVGLLAGQYLRRGNSRARFGSFQREFTEARPGLSGTPKMAGLSPAMTEK